MDEVPLIRGSRAFASRLCAAASKFDDSRYRSARRVNWSHKYADEFFSRECSLFLEQPDKYLDESLHPTSELEDVFELRMSAKFTARIFVKVILHRVFGYIGKSQRVFSHRDRSSNYRKAYVEDIDLVYAKSLPADRFVYPFPISVKRQIKYIVQLHRSKEQFYLSGHDYLATDLIRFLCSRTLCSLLRLESRAQLRHAKRILQLGYTRFELSDEFDLGSLEFCRALRRYPVHIVNGAHGVGKYLPIHCYPNFKVITERQIQYYRSIIDCSYQKYLLNVNTSIAKMDDENATCSVVFVSQVSDGVSPMISEAENEVLPILFSRLSGREQVRLFYRPHPNQSREISPAGFRSSSDIKDYGPEHKVVYLSLFSTTHIDPNFRGESFLVQTRFIRPEIAFDNDGRIIPISRLADRLISVVDAKTRLRIGKQDDHVRRFRKP